MAREDALSVMKAIVQKVSMEVPFLPGQGSTAEGKGSATGELVSYTHTFREAPAAHVLEYLDIVTKSAAIAFAAPIPTSGDVFQGIRDSIRGAQDQVQTSLDLLAHITGIEDEAFLRALTPSQGAAFVEAYEACNPSLAEFKKKLEMTFEAAAATLVAHATEKMLRAAGHAPQTA